MSDVEKEKAQDDERKVARGAALGLPLATVALASAGSVVLGAPIGILVLGAGALLGSIAFLWASLRILTGDAALGPELEALGADARDADALATRKKMLLRSLKDLENERALGKLGADDYEQIASTARAELKDVLKSVDASLEPFRERAEKLAREHRVVAGEAEKVGGGDQAKRSGLKRERGEVARVVCPTCEASNEADAAFCKKCGTALGSTRSEDTDDAPPVRGRGRGGPG